MGDAEADGDEEVTVVTLWDEDDDVLLTDDGREVSVLDDVPEAVESDEDGLEVDWLVEELAEIVA